MSNQVDLVYPLDWNTKINLPSETQAKYILEIEQDRKEKIREIVKDDVCVVSFSAERKYNLSVLFSKLIDSLPTERRALYDMIRGFKVEDQFPKEALDALRKNSKPQGSDTSNKIKQFLKQNILGKGDE